CLQRFFNPSFAFSSHFDTDGAPLSELSWPSSLAVVAVSFSGLFTFIFLMLACLCCKKGEIGFKEFDNTEGEEYQAEVSVLASPASQNGPEVYVLPLTEVSLPVSKQPGRSIQLLKSSDLGRHSLLYLKEIGHGWFGKVLLGEVSAGLSTTQVVVKELKASASVQDQMQFLEEVQPYRTLQHPALLQCLAQCSEVTPYLLVMEFCPLGDAKSYLHSCRQADSQAPDPLLLQRMACDIASGLLHLHKNNFVHSDLALRNCLLTSDMSVKIGDYGLSHSRFKDDYYVTQDQIWVPLRWIAPELIDEVHGNLLIVDQTKSSNIWSLGVTLWELLELGGQPYRHYSDRQVLTYAVKEQQLKLPKPQLHFSMDERWYEVMQFCWLQPDLRPCSEEVHLLVTYLCAKGSSEAEEDFEQRWNALKPNLLGSASHAAISAALVLTPTPASANNSGAEQTQAVELASTASSSFPLLEHFSEGFHSDTGDDLLTVTETSQGLNFEYKWEQARAEQPYCSSSTFGPLGQGNPHYQDISPSYYEAEQAGVVPVLSAHSPSVSSEYYIRIEEQVERNLNSLDDSIVDYSKGLEAKSPCDSDSSPTVQITIEPFLNPAPNPSPVKLDQTHHCFSSSPDGNMAEQTSGHKTQRQTCLSEPEKSPESGSNCVHPGFCDPYLEENESSNWTSNHSANNNSLVFDGTHKSSCADLRHSNQDNRTESWSLTKATRRTFQSSKSNGTSEAKGDPDCTDPSRPSDSGTCIHLYPEGGDCVAQVKRSSDDPPTSSGFSASVKERGEIEERCEKDSGRYSELQTQPEVTCTKSPSCSKQCQPGPTAALAVKQREMSENSPALDRGAAAANSSFSLVGLGDYSEDEDDITDITSGIFADFNLDYAEVEEDELSPVRNQERTADSVETLNLSSSIPSTSDPSDQAFSPDPYNNAVLPKSLDSGYDTENNESPEFIFKELADPRGGERSPRMGGDLGLVLQVGLGQALCTSTITSEPQIKSLADETLYRDSDYFSDYDAEYERSPQEDGGVFCEGLNNGNFSAEKSGKNESIQKLLNHGAPLPIPGPTQTLRFEPDTTSSTPHPTPGWSMLSPFPPQMGGCLTKESGPAEDNLGLDTEHSVEEPSSELSSSVGSEPSSSVQQTPLCGEQVRAPLEEAEDEDDSEDSESDEELRTYNIHDEDSEESEDDLSVVPVVVSDCSRARNLRSLLKMPTLLTQSFCDELERKKKAVSFFDDVTVFLFDQESPTGE
uniref:non-specific serine/threonine protein kinase n=1 Tax=Tetraodon nigroviridis TaxID=99883 RepID=H3CWP4_TETNG